MKNVLSFDTVTPKFLKLQERSKNFQQVENNLICIKLVGVNQYDEIKAIRAKHIERRKEKSKINLKIVLNSAFKIHRGRL